MIHGGGSRFSKALKETFSVYAFDLVGLIAGFLVAYQLGVFHLAPWAIALYPAVLGGKSVIDGLLSGRLSTALHIGTVYPRFSNNSKNFRNLIEAIVVLTLVMSVAISAISMVFGHLFWGITFADFPATLAVVAGTMSLGLSLLAVTLKLTFVSFKRALDPDTMVYPLMSTVSSIFITLCYIAVLNLFFNFGGIGIITVALLGVINLVLVLRAFPRNLHDVEFIDTIRDSLASLMTVAIIVNLTGTLLKGIDQVLTQKVAVAQTKFYAGAIYTVYPAFLGIVSDVSSVIGSMATTKLALGMLRPKLSSVFHHAKSIGGVWLVSVVMFVLSTFVALLINGEFTLTNFSTLISIVLIANVLGVALTVILSHGLSILIFQKGLDPDNFVIPIENALAASIISVTMLIALVLLTLG